jgi:hypothetical protein
LVVGGFEFLCFHLITRFLEQGNFVKCIQLENRHDIFLEEKRLTLGRNSNLVEVTIDEWIKSGLTCETDSLVIVSLFDLFLKKDAERMLSQLEYATSEWALTDEFRPSEVVLLLPLQLEQDEASAWKALTQIGKKLIGIMEENGISYHVISLPTLYGPWQPIEYAFQQAFYNDAKNREEIQLSAQEWTYDAIYIDDAVNEIVGLINEEKIETCILKNKNDEQWKKCAEKLGINTRTYQNTNLYNETNSNSLYKEIDSKVDYEQGLVLQQQHLLRVLSSV